MFGQETKHAGIPKKSYITIANISVLNAVIHIPNIPRGVSPFKLALVYMRLFILTIHIFIYFTDILINL